MTSPRIHDRPRLARRLLGETPRWLALGDTLADEWYGHDWAPLPEIALLSRSRLRPGATVLNLGAHQCVVALMLLDVVGATGRVIAVEANGHNVQMARINRLLNGQNNLHIFHGAVGAASGLAHMDGGLNASLAGDDGVPVDAYSLAEIARLVGRPDVVYMDIEGAEWEVLRSARAMIQIPTDCRHTIDWFVEIHAGCGLEERGGAAESVVALFRDAGYRLFLSVPDAPFVHWDGAGALPAGRLFLTALAPMGDANTE